MFVNCICLGIGEAIATTGVVTTVVLCRKAAKAYRERKAAAAAKSGQVGQSTAQEIVEAINETPPKGDK